jgi:hypothetical protein
VMASASEPRYSGAAISAPSSPVRRRPHERSTVISTFLLLVGIIVTTSAWILMDELGTFSLMRDDFDYIAESRDWPTTVAHLLEPHNTHVVPLFRLWTFGLVKLAGRLESLPKVLGASSYVGLIAAMVAIGYLVARETGRPVVALFAMATLGISTVSHPTVTWFSAGQALWAGTAIVLTLALARSWSRSGGAWRFVAVALGVLMSPAIWSGGLAAGPATVAYLFAANPSRVRKPALLLIGITLGALLLILAYSQPHFLKNPIVWERHHDLWPRPIQGLFHTVQAIVEVCLFANLGIDAITTPWQAVALLVSLAALCIWSRRGRGRMNPLEASGATIAVSSCLLAFMLRGNLPYSSLRALEWYHAIPQFGAILFAAGWWAAVSAPGPPGLGRRQVSQVLAIVVILCLIHLPRGERRLVRGAPAYLPNEASAFPTPELRLKRALYYRSEFHDRQVRALARLDRVDRILRTVNASPETLRDLLGRVLVPGISEEQLSSDAFSMLAPRSRNAATLDALAARRPELIELLRPEPPAVPFWLDPGDPASQAVRKIAADPRDGLRAPDSQ